MRGLLVVIVASSLGTPAFSAEISNLALGQEPVEALFERASMSAPRSPSPLMSEQVMASYGCFFTGAAGTAAAVTFGAENLVNVVAGGIVVPANAAVLTIGVLGVVFASFCSVGQALTPMAVDLTERLAEPTMLTLTATSEYIQKFRDTVYPIVEITNQRIIEPAGDMARVSIAMTARGCITSKTCSRWLHDWASRAADFEKPQ